MNAESARYLLQPGTRVRKRLERLLTGAQRAGFLVVPRRLEGGQRFELEHRDYPKGLILLDIIERHHVGPCPISFIEFQFDQRHGPAYLLERLLTLVNHEPALIPARQTESERAELAAGAPDAEPMPGAHLGSDSRWQDLAVLHIRAQMARMRSHEARAWESIEAEGVHQMRVAVRRLRELLRTFHGVLPAESITSVRAELRWLCNLLGNVRDPDVQLLRLSELEAKADAGASLQPALNRYRRDLHRQQRAAHRELVAGLDHPRYRALVLALRGLATQTLAMGVGTNGPTIAEALPETVNQLLTVAFRHGEKATRRGRPDDLHTLRIDAKRLRYLLEYIEPITDFDIAERLRAASRLQSLLGDHQDACVAADAMRSYRDTHALRRQERIGMREMIRHEERHARLLRERFDTAWQQFLAVSRPFELC